MWGFAVQNVLLAFLLGVGVVGLVYFPSTAVATNKQEAVSQPWTAIEQNLESWTAATDLRHAWNLHRDGARCRRRTTKCSLYHKGYWYERQWWTLSPTVGALRVQPQRVVSCSQAKKIVMRSSHRYVSTVRCRGPVYLFRALDRRGRPVYVRVDSRTGAIS